MARSELANVLNRARELHDYVQALTDDERNYLLDLLLPEQEPVTTKKPKRRARKAGKSARAASLAGAIGGTANGKCVAKNGDYACGLPADSALHDPAAGYAGYHEFQPAQAQAAGGGD